MNNSSSVEDYPFELEEIDNLWRNINRSPSDPVAHFIWITSFTLACLGSLSNLLSVVVLLRLSSQMSTFVYLTALSLSDMITCLSIVVTHSVEYFVQSCRNNSLNLFLRYVEIVFGGVAAGSRVLSLWISTAVTMDRWILICYPIYGKQICTLKRARIFSRTLFLVAFLYSVPLFFEYEIIPMPNVFLGLENDNNTKANLDRNTVLFNKGYSDLAKRRLYRWAYMFFNGIFVYTLPTLMIVFFNLQLIQALRRLKKKAKHLREKSTNSRPKGSRRNQQSKYSITVMVIITVLTLLICRSPTIVLWVLWSFELTIKIFFDATTSSMVRRFHSIANLIAIFNAATNFLPFCVFGQLFRAECLTIYCCRPANNDFSSQSSRRKLEETETSQNKSQRFRTNGKIQESILLVNEQCRNLLPINSDSNLVRMKLNKTQSSELSLNVTQQNFSSIDVEPKKSDSVRTRTLV